MSREALLEKIKIAEAAAASDIEAAEKEQISARNKVPIDQDNLIKKARDSASSKSQKEIDEAKTDDDFAAIEKFYTTLGEFAKDKGVTINIISIIGDDCTCYV